MIVYGDPQFQCRYLTIIEALSEWVAQIDPENIDELRTLLVQVGQLEQGVCDLPQLSEEWTRHICDLTENAALTFYAAYSRMNSSLPGRLESPKKLLHEICERLRRLRTFGDEQLIIKIPEGFEFYALYPEQYCCTARDFLKSASASVSGKQSALIVGIRSIGTSLSALLKVVLETAGWSVKRVTVRPRGHPYERETQLELAHADRFDWGIVVDEGPGISGSSMASVARALSSAGISRTGFFPGHGREPGPSASAEVREIWKSTPRFFSPLDEVKWNGLSVHELLLKASETECEVTKSLADVSGGLWRNQAYASDVDWPAVCIPLERMKFLAGTKPGHRLLWKFQGFGSLRQEDLSVAKGRAFATRSVSSCCGFAATPWIEGKRLSVRDTGDPKVLESICEYIASSCGEPLRADEQGRGTERLGEMLYWNTKESLGDSYADSAKAAVALVPEWPSLPSYQDGRMAPWEWVRDSAGRICKTDCTGHDCDHTIVGRESVLWDIAGAIVEWNLDGRLRNHFVTSLRSKGIQIGEAQLSFFQLAYAAFRTGQCSLCAMASGVDSPEYSRLQSAAQQYRSRLKRQLDGRR